MAKIRSIIIKNFRSIADVEVDAKDLTIIVGDNDSGKSNILRALNSFLMVTQILIHHSILQMITIATLR